MDIKKLYDGGLTAALSVLNLEQAITWYKEILGFELLYRQEEMGWCELKSPVLNVNVGLSQVEELKGKGGNAVLTWGVTDIEKSRAYLEAKDVVFDGPNITIPNLAILSTFFDPDGNCFMLYQDLANNHDKK